MVSLSNYAYVYGVVAANQERGRYVWIYLYYRQHLWHCHSIGNAYELIKKLNEHEKLEKQRDKVKRKWEKQEKLAAKHALTLSQSN
jgi:hypothetical protein